MKVITIKVDAVRAGEEVRSDFVVEQRKGEVWNRLKVVTVISGTPESERKFVIQDNERLVVEGKTTKVVVYDREQNMSKTVDASEGELPKDLEEEVKEGPGPVVELSKAPPERAVPLPKSNEQSNVQPKASPTAAEIRQAMIDKAKRDGLKPFEPAPVTHIEAAKNSTSTENTAAKPPSSDTGQGAKDSKEVKK